jgi:hypothetical protein
MRRACSATCHRVALAPQYALGGDPGADELGLITHVQRAGDIVLTRPALLIERDWAFTLWDALPGARALLAASLSAHRTMINGRVLRAALAVTERLLAR